MNWAWATSLDHIWRSPSFPTWLTLAVAGFFAFIVLVTLLRAERSVANGALTIITLLAIGVAAASMLRGHEPVTRSASTETRSSPSAMFILPAMSCIEDLSGDAVGQACEKVLFGSAESTATAVSYASSMISRLTALGDASIAQKTMGPELQAMRRAIEHDRYGLVAQVLLARDRCTPTACPAYRSLTDNHQIITNMDQHTFENLVARYAPSWNAPPVSAANSPMAMLPTTMPTGRPTNAEFPSAANTPPISIMTAEPGTGAKPVGAAAAPPPARPGPAQSLVPPAAAAPATPPAPAAAKKQAATKRGPAAPTPLSPAAQAPAASDD
jgi:hypothetical protein